MWYFILWAPHLHTGTIVLFLQENMTMEDQPAQLSMAKTALLLTNKHVGSINYFPKLIWLHFIDPLFHRIFFQNSNWFMIEVIKTFCYIVKIYWLAARHKLFLRYHSRFFELLSASKPKCNFGHWSKMTLSCLCISYQSLVECHLL